MPADGLVRLRVTSPEKPLTRVKLRLTSTVEPVTRLRVAGDSAKLKSEAEAFNTVRESGALWLRVAVAPLTLS